MSSKKRSAVTLVLMRHGQSRWNAKNRFTGKTVIVTGGNGNFGQCCAKRMASEGCNVAL